MHFSDDLFLLIRSLSKNEKGYFKKYAAKHVVGGGNNYIRLFDFIGQMKEYDEALVKKHFRKETFIRHLPSEKNYLYHLLLRSLSEYHSGSSAEKQIGDLLHSIELLYSKGLFSQCRKLLNKAKKLSEHYQKPLIALQLHEWESMILKALAEMDAFREFSETSAVKQRQLIKQFDNYSQYRRLEERMFLLSKLSGFPRNREEKKPYERIMNHRLLKSSRHALSFRSSLHYFSINSYYQELMSRPQQTYKYRKELVEHMEKFPHLVDDDQQRYVIALNNLLNSQDELGLADECEETITKLNSLKTKSPNIRTRIFGYTWNIRMTQWLIAGDFEKIVSHAKEIEAGLKIHSRLLHPEFLLAFKYQFFYGFFGAGKFRAALKWMNELLDDETLKIRPEIYFFARIMNLILHFELKNTELLRYNIRNTYRLFIKQKRLYKFETVILNFIRRSGKYTTPAQMRKAFIQLREEIRKISDDPYEKQILGFFDIISWLDSKITKKSFGEVMKSKRK